MLERHCTRGRSVLTVAALAACLLVGSFPAGIAEAQTVSEGYSVTLSRFGGDGTLPKDLGFVCLWDDGIWTMTDYIDVGYFFIVGNKTYLLGGVEGEEHLSMVFKRRKGDLILGGPANSTELPGQDLLIVATAKWQRRDLGCTSREARTANTLLSTATLGASRTLRPER
jgi:hypothetical protein